MKIGTTKRGIGPAYEDKVGRRAIRLMDLAEPDALDDKIARLLAHHNPLRRGLGLARRFRPRRCCGRAAQRRAESPALHGRRPGTARHERRAGKRILFEGAQGALLDVDHGTYPLRHLVEHRRGQRRDRLGARAQRDRLCSRHRQGLYDARRRRPVSDRTARRDRPAARRPRPANLAPIPAGGGAAAGSTPC